MKVQNLPEPVMSTTACLARKVFEDHKSLCDNWEHGYIDYVFYDESGNLCIKYEDRITYHYNCKGTELIWFEE